MAEMLKGGVIMDVVNVEQARIAEDAGAVAVMASAPRAACPACRTRT
ncbi:UNVERIFIED_ORG: pyridoxal biosynthesis lyase PdxS [Arthrobacter sp. UYEF13]